MKIALITSQTTFMPDNYNLFIQRVLESDQGHITHLIESENKSFSLSLKGLGLYFIGAKKIGLSLFLNSLFSYKNKRIALSSKHKIKFKSFKDLNERDCLDYLKSEKIDLIINARTRSIYKRELLELPKYGCINIHHGLLPDQRGTLCDLWAMYEKKDMGFSIHKMTPKLDDGDIIKTFIVAKAKSKNNYYQYQIESMEQEAQVLSQTLDQFVANEELPVEQENISNRIKYYKTPNQKQIKDFLAQGITL